MSLRHRVEGAIAGVVVCSVVYIIISNLAGKQKRCETVECDDECNSLFYASNVGDDGTGLPSTKSLDDETVTRLTNVHKDFRFLSKDIYKAAVENLPICCVDIICQRKKDKKLLLFFRRDKPAASIWWWPGGRLFRGETFFDAAIRKIRDETGNPVAKVRPVGVIDVWNTFFPDSNWDADREPGKEGTQTVNISVVCELDDDIKLDDEAKKNWAVDAHRWVDVSDCLATGPGAYDKYVRLNCIKALQKKLLL